jgi:hypothetical protein
LLPQTLIPHRVAAKVTYLTVAKRRVRTFHLILVIGIQISTPSPYIPQHLKSSTWKDFEKGKQSKPAALRRDMPSFSRKLIESTTAEDYIAENTRFNSTWLCSVQEDSDEPLPNYRGVFISPPSKFLSLQPRAHPDHGLHIFSQQ